MHLTGGQWGVMNETGSYPGQPWLWLYQLWYHVNPFNTSANVDVWAVYLTGIATLLLLLIPFIPGLRDFPRLIPVHRLIWRDWTPGGPPAEPAADTMPAIAQTAPGTASRDDTPPESGSVNGEVSVTSPDEAKHRYEGEPALTSVALAAAATGGTSPERAAGPRRDLGLTPRRSPRAEVSSRRLADTCG